MTRLNGASRPASRRDLALSFFGETRLANALVTVSIAVAVLANTLRALVGWPGLIGILVVLVVFAALSLFARRETIDYEGILPISLLVFLGWAGISVVWSEYQWATLAGIGYLGVFSALGIYIALMRDTIQIVRTFGDVLRLVLLASLVLEIFSGLLIDTPIRFLGIEGHLDIAGPIQGLMGTRNQLGVIALIAAVTFGTELRTKSIRPGLAIASLVLAGITMVFTRSPLIGGVIVVLAVAIVSLYALRRVTPARRTYAQLGLLAGVAVVALVAWGLRATIIALSNAGGELDYRLQLWNEMTALIRLNPVEGWGWIGHWRPAISPFEAFVTDDRVPRSGVNAYLDVWFQLGGVGILIFVGLVGLAFVRSWLLAGQKRSVVFAWPALVLVVLLSSALFESSLLVEYGWLTFVVCCVKASQDLSWRTAFARPLEQEPLD
ncbi:O-antigen ligase family protein [Conyzicola sp.]|uniref:O-antigen ligase family protein n=1 Tax=Conyzicola sp. TaxID=1969404 RepID=UPI00398931F8